MKNIEFKFENTAGETAENIQKMAEQAEPYRLRLAEIVEKQDWIAPEASILLPDQNLEILDTMLQKYKTERLRYVVIIGMGGSMLGTQALYFALRKNSNFKNFNTPSLLFLDTLSDEPLTKILSFLEKNTNDADEILINLVSKSGRTLESLANFELLIQELSKRFENILERVVITTDENSPLWDEAIAKNIETLAIPKMVGGKFSVFSAVGLFPLGLCGLNIRELLEGAREARALCLSNSPENNPALARAVIIYLRAQKGETIHNNFFFNAELEAVGKWYRQLVGEGLGRKYNQDGEVVHNGITPMVSVAPADLHSMIPLYLGGPKDKFTTFIFSKESDTNLPPLKNKVFDIIEGLGKMNHSDLTQIIYKSVRAAYVKEKLPFLEIQLSVLTPHTLGALLQTQMLEIMYLAHLQGVDAFHQPSVECYKEEMRQEIQNFKTDKNGQT